MFTFPFTLLSFELNVVLVSELGKNDWNSISVSLFSRLLSSVWPLIELRFLQVNAHTFPPYNFGGIASKVKKFCSEFTRSFSKNTSKHNGHIEPFSKSGLNLISGCSFTY